MGCIVTHPVFGWKTVVIVVFVVAFMLTVVGGIFIRAIKKQTIGTLFRDNLL